MMRLRRKFSGVLPSKKPDPDLPIRIEPLTTVTEVDTEASILHDDLHERQLQSALLSSLKDQHESLERDLAMKDHEIARLQQRLCQDAQQNAQQGSLFELATRSQRELRETTARMRQENEMLRTESERQLSEHRTQTAEHLSTINEYRNHAASMSEIHNRLQARVEALQAENAALLQARVIAQADAGQQAMLMDALQASTRQQAERVRSLQARITEAEADAARKAEQHAEEMKAYRKPAGWAVATPRTILACKLLAKGFQAPSTAERPEVTFFMRSCSLATLTNQSLDVHLNRRQANEFVHSIDDDAAGLALLRCSICLLLKIAQTAEAPRSLRIDEFPSRGRPTSCCSQYICTTCYLEGIATSLRSDWWSSLRSSNWITCPGPDCRAKVLRRGRPEKLLRELGDGEISEHMEFYNRIKGLRDAFRAHSVEDDALGISYRIHRHLFERGKMRPLSDIVTHNRVSGNNDHPPVLDLERIKMVRVDRGAGSVEVPLLVSLLRQSTKCCVICAEDLVEIDIGSPDEWPRMFSQFPGDWMWRVLLFPERMRMPRQHTAGFCRHDINFCTSCLQRHLEMQLEQRGRAGCDRLTCPSEGCRRALAYDEIKLYAKDETFQKYDRYLNLNCLSEDPAFRWCLRPGCTNGDLYDDEGGPIVQCSECAFEMCFEHCVPWHKGQTCKQYDSVKEHGDPDYQKTTEWIAENTKPCPSCNRNIQKGEACFHMTCSQCQAQFCWLCLADWGDVNPRPGVHNANAHREGCPFRTNGLTPSQLQGETFEEAMRSRAPAVR